MGSVLWGRDGIRTPRKSFLMAPNNHILREVKKDKSKEHPSEGTSFEETNKD